MSEADGTTLFKLLGLLLDRWRDDREGDAMTEEEIETHLDCEITRTLESAWDAGYLINRFDGRGFAITAAGIRRLADRRRTFELLED